MCGFAGFLSATGSSRDEGLLVLRRMADTLRHRGPDDSGLWLDSEGRAGFGFRRLSIIDVSPAGHQPMQSASGRYVIAYNGEVYNFESIRKELHNAGAAPAFRGHSDTEVMLAAIEAWGLAAAVGRFIGMFAFALWDRQERQLHLVRDRVGVKPLYFGWSRGTLLFGSELKALRAHPAFAASIDRGSVALLMRHNYIPAPYSIYQGFEKVRPGTIVTFQREQLPERSVTTYWSAVAMAEEGQKRLFMGDENEAADQLEELLRDAVRLRMIADVPLGVFLSGGFDSTIVTAMMQAQTSHPVKTFTIGFAEDGYNEAPHAKRIAAHFGTDHTELYVSAAEAQSVVPKLPVLFDEPFADSSQIPTYLVSALARQRVTVSLSGDGGDELFGGYNRYFWGRTLWNKTRWLPGIVRRSSARALALIPPARWSGTGIMSTLVQRRTGLMNLADKASKLGEILRCASPDEMYRQLVSHWTHPETLVLGGFEPPTSLTDQSRWPQLSDFTHRMMLHDLVTYLPDDILVKVDRASMSVSLEAREPLLDHRLIEFAWRLPLAMKVRDREGKRLLRKVLYRHVPREMMDRPKMGFGIPIDSWLRGPLRDWAESLLDESTLRQDGFLDPAPVREKWEEHLAGTKNWQYPLWDVLMFQAWLRESAPGLESSTAAYEVSAAMS